MLLLTALLALTFARAEAPLWPEKELYHMGQKRHLLEDSRLGNIPEDAWKEFILGDRNGSGLVPWRRGLYGGDAIDSLEIFSNALLGSRNGSPRVPWVMKVVVRDECLRGGAVTDLAHDPKCLRWIQDHKDLLRQNGSLCYNAEAKTCLGIITGTQPLANGAEENVCDQIMQRMLGDTAPRVVRDTEWPGSWYLRDRGCIERLDASPGEVLEILAGSKWDWASRKATYKGANGYGTSTVAILIGALADSAEGDPAVLTRIRARAAASDIRLGSDESARPWVRETAPAAIDAYTRCSRTAKGARDFRRLAARLEADLHEAALVGHGEKLDSFLGRLTESLRDLCSARLTGRPSPRPY